MKAIVTYHSIDDSGSVVSVHPERFRMHVEHLAERGIPVLSLREVLSPDCEAGVAITFDDGFANLASVAWPILRSHGFSATAFVATDWVGRDNGWDPDDARIPRLPLLGWSELAGLAQEGLTIASHSRSHPRLTELDARARAEELEESAATIEARLGERPLALAYPYGDYDSPVKRAAEAAGYRWAVTTDLAPLGGDQDPLALPRLDAFYLAKPGIMERWGTSGFLRYMMFRRAARTLRASLRRPRVRA